MASRLDLFHTSSNHLPANVFCASCWSVIGISSCERHYSPIDLLIAITAASAGYRTGLKMGPRQGSAAAVSRRTWLAKNTARKAIRDPQNADPENQLIATPGRRAKSVRPGRQK